MDRLGAGVVGLFLILATTPARALDNPLPKETQKPGAIKTQNNDVQQKDTADTSTKPKSALEKKAEKESPSFQEKKWTGTQGAYESNLEYDYVPNTLSDLGNGHDRGINENYFDFRQLFMRHTLLAFLVQGGLEYQHTGFNAPNNSIIPGRLDNAMASVGIDFRWSEKDLLHLETRPGFYTDWRGSGWDAINSPLDIGYTRVVSKRFQWVAGFSFNSWRSSRFLGAAGFRWQINDRWKLKMYLPRPDVEYLARPNLTLTFGADIRGDSYRVGPHFGDSHGIPRLNNALLDYQEVRIGPGFSWNVRPLIEVNVMTGYMVGRTFDYYNNGPKLAGGGAPFINVGIHMLFKLPGEQLAIPQRNDVSLHNILKFL